MAYEGKSTGGFKSSKPRTSDAGPSKPKQTTEPRAAPSFVSTLQDEGADFPRGGGSALTPLELKQTRAEGRREAEQDVAREVSARGTGYFLDRADQVVFFSKGKVSRDGDRSASVKPRG